MVSTLNQNKKTVHHETHCQHLERHRSDTAVASEILIKICKLGIKTHFMHYMNIKVTIISSLIKTIKWFFYSHTPPPPIWKVPLRKKWQLQLGKILYPSLATLFVLVGLSLIHLQKILFKIPYIAFKPSIVSVCFSNSKYFRPPSPFFLCKVSLNHWVHSIRDRGSSSPHFSRSKHNCF